MGKIIFIIGGARSGKSSYALAAAKRYTGRVAFIATAEAGDAEMKERIRRHRKQRPAHWRTFEEPRDVQGVITDIGSRFSCVVVDCLTLLVSNLLLAGYSDSRITKKIKAVAAILPKADIFNAVVNWLRTDSGMEPISQEKSGIATLIDQRNAARKQR